MHRKQLVARRRRRRPGRYRASAGRPAPTTRPPSPEPNTVAKDLLSPLSLAVTNDGTVFYSQNFAGCCTSSGPARSRGRLPGRRCPAPRSARSPSTRRQPAVRDDVPARGGGPGRAAAALMGLGKKGKVQASSPTCGSYEENQATPTATSPTASATCRTECEVPEVLQPYTGIVESHPYAHRAGRRRDLHRRRGRQRDPQVRQERRALHASRCCPPQPVVVTEADSAGGRRAPGVRRRARRYIFEPVPTDVEVGPDGKLYVTTLPGGPEDPSLGARASVYRVDPKTGNVKKVVSGLLSATGLAVGKNGKMFVAELFRGRIAQVKPGGEPKRLSAAPRSRPTWRSAPTATSTPPSRRCPGEGEPPAGKVIRIRR